MIPQLGPTVPGGTGLTLTTDPARQSDDSAAGAQSTPVSGASLDATALIAPVPAASEPDAPAASPRDTLPVPDPSAPAGPPPAFEASILDRLRDEARDVSATSEPAAPFDISAPPGPDEQAPADASEARYDVPPSADARAEAEVATVRRIETPYDTATVDVSR